MKETKIQFSQVRDCPFFDVFRCRHEDNIDEGACRVPFVTYSPPRLCPLPTQAEQPDSANATDNKPSLSCDGCSNLRGRFCLLSANHCIRGADDDYYTTGE